MNPEGSIQFSQKILLQKAYDLVSNTNNTQHHILKEIIKIFNIEANLSSSSIQGKIKQKFIKILLEEKKHYKDYLLLPKFNTITQQTRNWIIGAFDKVWTEFQKEQQQINQKKLDFQASKLIPPLIDIRKRELFHLHLLTMYKQSPLCPLNYQTRMGGYPMRWGQFSPYAEPVYSGQDPQYFMNYPLQNMPSQQPSNEFPPKRQWDGQLQSNPQIFPPLSNGFNFSAFNEKKDSIFEKVPTFPLNNISSVQQINHSFSQIPDNQAFNNRLQNLNQENDKRNKSIQKKSNVENIKMTQNVIIHSSINQNYCDQQFELFQFANCVCKAQTKVQNPKYFECKQCKYYFHIQCLRVKIEIGNRDVLCPGCSLKKPTLFTQVRQCLDMNWFIPDKIHQNWTCVIKKKHYKRVLAQGNRLQIHLRFLKINGTRIFDSDDQQEKSWNKINLSQPQVVKYSSIKIDEKLFANFQQDIPLQGSVKKANILQSKSELYFFGTYLIMNKTPQQIMQQTVEDITKHVGDQQVKKFINQEDLSINLIDLFYNRSITIPVRGNNCNHAQVFDLESFLQFYNELRDQKPKCPHCLKKVANFIIDDYISQIIRENGKQNKIIKSITILTNGDVQCNQYQSFEVEQQQMKNQQSDNYSQGDKDQSDAQISNSKSSKSKKINKDSKQQHN